MLLGKALLAAAEPSFRAATAVGAPRKPARWNVFPVEQVRCLALLVPSAYSIIAAHTRKGASRDSCRPQRFIPRKPVRVCSQTSRMCTCSKGSSPRPETQLKEV